MDEIIWSMQYTVYSLLKKPEYKKLNENCSGTLLFTEKVTFEDDLGHFLYDSIWSNMMYNLRKWCLKSFPCILSL